MKAVQVSPFTGRVFERTLPPRLRSAKSSALPMALQRIIRPEAAMRWMLPSLASLTPAYIEAILRGAIAGNHVQQWELFNLMEDTWPRLQKNLGELKDDAVAYNWKLEAYAEEDTPPTDSALERKKLVSAALFGMRPRRDFDENSFAGTVFDILDAWAKGVAVLEVEWEYRDTPALGQIIAPRTTFWVHPTNYAWSPDGQIGLVAGEQLRSGFLSQIGSTAIEPFPEHKFLVALCKSRSGHPMAGALLRPLAFWWAASNFSQEWFLNFAQIFGLPIRWANYDPNIPGLLENVADMLEAMGSAAWGAFPAGTTLEIKEPMKAGTDNPQVALIDRADKNCDLLILRQTLTSDVQDSGSRALGEVHESSREREVYGCATFAADVLGQLIESILLLNYGDTEECPKLCPEPKQAEDTEKNAKTIETAVRTGIRVPEKWAHKKLGIPLPQADEPIVQPRQTTPPPAGEEDPETRLHAQDATDKVVDQALEDLTGVEARWLGAVKPIFRELVAMAENDAVTDVELLGAIERAQRRMPELFLHMDHKALEDALYAAMSAGAVNGAVRGYMRRGGVR